MAIAWALAGVFALGVAHKLGAPSAFLLTLRQYRVLPGWAQLAAATLVIFSELAVTAGLVLRPSAAYVGWATLALLGLYTVAIAFNLARGRRDIDCGCSGPALRQTLSGSLLWRNGVLMLLALCLTAPLSASRSLHWLDAVAALAFAGGVLLVYITANQLIANERRLTEMLAR